MTAATSLIRLQSEPAVLSVNFDQVRKHIETRVAEYDIVVTAESVAAAKKLATDLNKQRLELEGKRKEAVAKVSEPIKEFEGQMKELSQLYADGRQRILVQVEKFENETRDLARELLIELRDQEWDQHSVDPEFRRAEVDDLIKLTAVTKAGNLSASAIGPLRERVRQDRDLQAQTEKRLLELENRSYKAGLKAPLTRDHVEHFLFADDQQYETQIERILTAEVARQDRIEEEARQKMERMKRAIEAREREVRERAEQEREQENLQKAAATEDAGSKQEIPATEDARQTPVRSEDPAPYADPPTPAPAGKVAWTVNCSFRVECSPKVTQQAIEAQLRRVMTDAGITTLESVQAIRQADGGKS